MIFRRKVNKDVQAIKHAGELIYKKIYKELIISDHDLNYLDMRYLDLQKKEVFPEVFELKEDDNVNPVTYHSGSRPCLFFLETIFNMIESGDIVLKEGHDSSKITK